MKALEGLKAAVGEGLSEVVKPVVLTSKEDKFKQLAEVAKILNKQFDTTNSIVKLGNKVGQKLPSIALGCPSFDEELLGCGGIPRGRLIEIYGPESSGKTTFALELIAAEQNNTDNLCAVIDAEHALDLNYASKLGVNVDELLISQPDSGEQALETAEALIDSHCVSTILIDSVAALVPQAELDGEMGDSNMGLQARLMSQACRKLRGKAALNGVTVIFINQIREKIGVMFGSPETTTGGRALKFYTSVRLDIRRKEIIKEGEVIVGHKMKIKAVKNKVGIPLKEIELDLKYGVGIDKFRDFVEYAKKKGVIEQAGPWVKFDGKNIAQGLTNAVEAVRVDTALQKAIKERMEEI